MREINGTEAAAVVVKGTGRRTVLLEGLPFNRLGLGMRAASRIATIGIVEVKQRMQQMNRNTQIEYGEGCKGYTQPPESVVLQALIHRISAFVSWTTFAQRRVFMHGTGHKQNELNTQ